MTEDRKIESEYADPVDLIWLRAAARLGYRVERVDDAYASYDGAGTLRIAASRHFDADDSLAQMILHELCHAYVAGEGAEQKLDWGLDNASSRDSVLEHATHRLQAHWARRHGLRQLFAVTTDHRGYWDALPEDPLTGDAGDAAVELARLAWVRARSTVGFLHLEDAFEATRLIADAAAPFAPSRSLWSGLPQRHAAGFPLHADSALSCGQCAWSYPHRKETRCLQTRRDGQPAARVDATAQACERWEPRFDASECGRCGACCREGYHLICLSPREPFARRHPGLVQADGDGLVVPRPDGRCVALEGQGPEPEPYRCAVYDDRPRACRDFPIAGLPCLQARQRVGLSR